MKYYTEPSREIPVAAETEVLVVGGGPAGIGASIAAARQVSAPPCTQHAWDEKRC